MLVLCHVDPHREPSDDSGVCPVYLSSVFQGGGLSAVTRVCPSTGGGVRWEEVSLGKSVDCQRHCC